MSRQQDQTRALQPQAQPPSQNSGQDFADRPMFSDSANVRRLQAPSQTRDEATTRAAWVPDHPSLGPSNKITTTGAHQQQQRQSIVERVAPRSRSQQRSPLTGARGKAEQESESQSGRASEAGRVVPEEDVSARARAPATAKRRRSLSAGGDSSLFANPPPTALNGEQVFPGLDLPSGEAIGGSGGGGSGRGAPAKRWPTIIKSWIKMARQRYFVSLLCLSLFVVACLLVTVAISRTIGSLGTDLDSDPSAQAAVGAGRSADPLVEQFEVRSFELADLTESGKTFAYTRWLIKVRVPKSAPSYEQRSPSGAAVNATQAAPPDPAEEQYRTIRTRAFVSDQPATASPGGEDSISKRQRRSPPGAPEAAKPPGPPLADQGGVQAEGAALEPELAAEPRDPIQVAASELSVEPGAINKTLLDCFIVDTEKRPAQKLKIEQQHLRLASTRRVSFKRMLATITACRMLSWASLAAQLEKATPTVKPTQQTLPPPPPIPIERRPELRILGKRAEPAPAPVPVRAQQPQTQPAKTDPFGSLVDVLVTWSRLYNTSGAPQASQSPPAPPRQMLLDANESRRATRDTQDPGPSGKADRDPGLVEPEPGQQTGTGEPDEEAKRASYLNMGMSMVGGLVPNTLWCGLGDRAANYSELGSEFLVDACCRAHDHCPIRLRPFMADYGLINWSMSTRSHCDCDLDFSSCLVEVNSTLSNVIKTLYFRFVGLQCIDLGGEAGQQQQQ